MDSLKIIDFDYGLGGFTCGLERWTGLFEVIDAPWLNSKNNLSYNLNHKNFFEQDCEIADKKYDMAVFTPYFGENYTRRGSSNFSYENLNNVIFWIKENRPNFVVIVTSPDVVSFMSNNVELTYTADNWPVYDLICHSLQDYQVYQFVIDGAFYGVPQHYKKNFYLCFKKQIALNKFNMPEMPYNRKKGFVTIEDAIGDIVGTDYSSKTSNFISLCRVDNPRLTWHEPNYKNQELCSFVKQGESAKNTAELHQKRGYNRPRYNKICPKLNNDFYLVSSKASSIHPVANRPFTIREGARLFGLPDTFVWNTSLSKKDVATLISNSTSPIFGVVVGEIILNLIK